MGFVHFELERGQSLWEHVVEINLTESGVHPVTLEELVRMGLDMGELQRAELGYIQTNGTLELRRSLCRLYPGATVDHILITNGTAEANFLLAQTLLGSDSSLLCQLPNYLQFHGLASNLGANLQAFRLRQSEGWELDWEEFHRNLSPETRVIYLSNPNNPTGWVMSRPEAEKVAATVGGTGTYLIADEVYQGAEWEGDISPSFWGLNDQIVVTSGLSKAYGIPGVRIGWIVGPPALIEACWARRDYTTIAVGTLSDLIARFAVRPEIRKRLFSRGRQFLGANKDVFHDWVESFGGFLEYTEPRAGAYAFVRYNDAIPSVTLCERIRERHSVLVVPGTWMGTEGHLRIGLGGPREDFVRGLESVKIELDRLRTGS